MAGMGNIAELLKLLVVGGGAGAAGAGIGAMGRGAPQTDPRLDAMKQIQMLNPAAREGVMSRDDLQNRARNNMQNLQSQPVMDRLDDSAPTIARMRLRNGETLEGRDALDAGNLRGTGRLPDNEQRNDSEPDSDEDDVTDVGWEGTKESGPTSNDVKLAQRLAEEHDREGGQTPIYGSFANRFGSELADHHLMGDDSGMIDMKEVDKSQRPLSTEDELNQVHREINGADQGPPWDGTDERVPTAEDFAYLKENPTDGTISNFLETYPDWSREDLIKRGINPGASPDQYAMDDETWADLPENKDRSTRIDER